MLSITTFMRTFYAPAFWFGRLKHATIDNYLSSLRLYLGVVGDVPINEINAANNARFLNDLNYANAKIETIRKHCRQLNTIFAKMGPPAPRNRDAFGFLPVSPWIRPPQAFKTLPREVPDSYVDRLYLATTNFPGCFEFPAYLEDSLRPHFWKALILLASTTALRKSILFGLTWHDVSPCRSYITIPATMDKCRTERRKPLHPEVNRLLESIRFSDKLLHWGHGEKKFYEIWRFMNAFAGIEPHLNLHDLKRYALQLACRSNVDAATLLFDDDPFSP